MIEKIFGLQKAQTTLQREIAGGLTTFMTMAYIIFVQPAVLGAVGMDREAVMVATCLSSAFATFLMAFLANYPIALAPAMGHNFFFAYTVVLTLKYSWQQALGAIFISGVLFIVVSFVGLRERLVNTIPSTLKNGIAAGIGLLIAVVGLEWAGIVVYHPGTLVSMGKLSSPPVLLSLFGLTVMAILLALGMRSAILLGILATFIVGLMTDMVSYGGIIGPVPSIKPTFFKLDIMGALETGMLSIVFVFFFLALFDTVGTLIGVSQEAGLLQPDGTLPRARQALLSDAIGTVSGALLGTSTVTCYIESATGVSAGARTGLANIMTGLMFLLAIFFAPLVKMIGGGMKVGEGLVLYPIIAPALIIVGCFMLKNISQINWNDFGEAIPAFLTIILMPFTFSITEGISFGFISYTLLKTVQGKIKEVPLLVSGFAILFLIRYIFLSV
ncbi:MAG: NCS2 family permease [Thermodesulfobacteriota bacterium]|jgi:AGZA family xanthine/uracil permease-like MFS transporter|nr:MAG: NCS2 family permease [Thermodesulfobacteriota bacterium]